MIRRTIVKKKHSGFSLIELLFVITLIGLIATLSFSRYLKQADTAAGERVLEQIASRLQLRRNEAIRLNGNRAATSLETETAPPVEINLTSLSTTASLIIDGTDIDNDGIDDETGTALTRLEDGNWQYAYRADPLSLPNGWVIGTPPENVGLIGGGATGRGIATTRIGFDGDGQAYGSTGTELEQFPPGATLDDQLAPFWAIYMSNGSGNIAIALYPSGTIEKFRFDGTVWRGWRGQSN